jgi:hypothetical protein
MKIPEPITRLIEANNKHNLNEFLAVIAHTAVINDEGHDYHGIAEIKRWCDEKLISAGVTLEPIKVVKRYGKTIVTMKVDGNFDKTGLPDPFVLDFYFTLDLNSISRLSIHLPNRKITYLKALGFSMI